jgi:hypothetical protein
MMTANPIMSKASADRPNKAQAISHIHAKYIP